MLESNEQDLEKFVAEKRRNDVSERTIETYVRFVTELDEVTNKPFREVEEDDINAFVDMKGSYCNKHTMTLIKTVIKTFYKWLFGLKDTYPPAVAKLEANGHKRGNGAGNAEDLDIKDILVKDDIALLVKYCEDDRDEAIVTVLYESGTRIGEFTGMKVGDLADDRHGKKITVNGKTGKRTLLLVESVPYLNKWLEHYPTKANANSPLWCSIRAPYKALTIGQIDFMLGELKRRSGVTKKLNPHNFRHSRATYLARFMSDAQMKKYFGWSKASNMQAIYVHLAGKDNDNAILKSAGIEETEDVVEKSPLLEKECPRCRTKNTGVAAYCQLCGRPFSEGAVLPEMNELDDLRERVNALTELMNKVLTNPKNLNEVIGHVENITLALGDAQLELEGRKVNRNKCSCGAEAKGEPIKTWMLGKKTKVSRSQCSNGHEFNIYEKLTPQSQT
jgi:site-specific recombinase XerD